MIFLDGFSFNDPADLGDVGKPLPSSSPPPTLTSWDDYYELRNLPPTSPAALLLHFPLTMYKGLQTFAAAQREVARILDKPLNVHVVGVEKELNFLDIFHELFHLFAPSNLFLNLTFVVRSDMLPAHCESGYTFKLDTPTTHNTISVVSGTYNESLDPNFDCGGKPDVVFAMNAGIYAYESWRFVVEYLENSGCLGIFTDYNEYSGLNCASLGGRKCRER